MNPTDQQPNGRISFPLPKVVPVQTSKVFKTFDVWHLNYALFSLLTFFSCLLPTFSFAQSAGKEQAAGYTLEDRDRAIRMEATLEQFMKATDKRLEELRSDMNARFEQVDNRFESADNRMNNMMLLFGGLVAAIIGFAIWDRRTMIRSFETKVKEIDIAIEQLGQEKTANKILTALRELAKKDMPLAEVLRTYNLL